MKTEIRIRVKDYNTIKASIHYQRLLTFASIINVTETKVSHNVKDVLLVFYGIKNTVINHYLHLISKVRIDWTE